MEWLEFKIKYKNTFVITLIDKEDLHILQSYNWRAKITKQKDYYIFRQEYKERKRYTYYLHNILINCPKDNVTDHINHNKLDNRKENLRVATARQNQHNHRKKQNTKFKWKGYYYRNDSKRTKPWHVQIKNNQGKKIHIGTFRTEKEAAIAYNNAAIKYFGKFALLNKIED